MIDILVASYALVFPFLAILIIYSPFVIYLTLVKVFRFLYNTLIPDKSIYIFWFFLFLYMTTPITEDIYIILVVFYFIYWYFNNTYIPPAHEKKK